MGADSFVSFAANSNQPNCSAQCTGVGPIKAIAMPQTTHSTDNRSLEHVIAIRAIRRPMMISEAQFVAKSVSGWNYFFSCVLGFTFKDSSSRTHPNET